MGIETRVTFTPNARVSRSLPKNFFLASKSLPVSCDYAWRVNDIAILKTLLLIMDGLASVALR